MNASIKKRSLSAAVACALLAGGCGALATTGSGRLVTMTVPAESFSRIEVSDGFDLQLSTGATESVTLRLDDNLVDELDVGVSEGTLRLRTRDRRTIRKATLRADVVAVSVTTIRADGGSKLQLGEGLSLETIGLDLSGGSSVDGAVATEKVDLGMSGGSRAKLRGHASGLHLSASGGSVLEGGDLHVRDAHIRLSGGARASTAVSTTISADLSGASSLKYVGSPSFVRRDISGNSSISNG